LSLFSLTGEFFRVIGSTEAGGKLNDVCFASNGDIVAAGSDKHDILVFSPDGPGSRLLRRFGSNGERDGQFKRPIAVAFAQGRLYVLDAVSARVQVFE